MILFGHQTGNPNAHHAALAHFERGRLAAFVLPWFPGIRTLDLLKQISPTREMAMRLSRRRFEPLAGANFVQGRLAEFRRLLVRAAGGGDNRLCYEVNDWLMDTMQREVSRREVTAVHSPEDASLRQFEEAKKRGKACIYDMPIGYYPWWDEKQKRLARDFVDWVPAGGLPSSRYVRPEQKVKEMELADLVLVACSFVEKTIREFLPDKNIAIAPYGVDAGFWAPGGAQHGAWSREHGAQRPEAGDRSAEDSLLVTSDSRRATPPLRFIYAGGCSIRKGIPVLLEAWEKAQLREAELTLVGSWQLAVDRLKQLPRGVRFIGPVGPEKLRELYRQSHVFVFPSFFEGFGLVILEAMACGLPVIASDRSAGPDVLDASCGCVVTAGDVEQLIETFRWFGVNRDKLPAMKRAARAKAEGFTWEQYRAAVSEAVTSLV
jgi:glycosyltransferase involved in cell wall biosynthesis